MQDKNYELAVQLRHELHQHPELSHQEFWTKQHLMDFIRTNTSLEVVDRGAWFYAFCKGRTGKKSIAFRADFDALPIDETIGLPYGSQFPGVSHKCGHDGHAAGLAGLALELDEKGCDNDIYLVFQHAEEVGGGGEACSRLLADKKIDETYACHNKPGLQLDEIETIYGCQACASTGMSLYFKGVSSHASNPGAGRNPAEAIAKIILALPEIQDPANWKGYVLATVINVDIGEVAFGTSAHTGVLRLTLRAWDEEEMNQMIRRIDGLAYALSVRYGLEYSKDFCDYFPETRNHDEGVKNVIRAAEKLGKKVIFGEYPDSGSEDYGYFTNVAMGAYFNVGAGGTAELHTWGFDFPDPAIRSAVDMFLTLAELE